MTSLMEVPAIQPKWIKPADAIIGLYIFGPLSITAFRGLWDIEGTYLLSQGNYTNSNWILLVAGFILRYLVNINQSLFCTIDTKIQWKICRVIYRVTYNIIVFAFMTAHWQGIWNLLDIYTGFGNISNVICLFLSLVILWISRASTNMLAAPYFIKWDGPSDPTEFFQFQPRFRTQRKTFLLFLLDHFFGHIFVTSSVVATWRCMWNLQDNNILPDNPPLSNGISLGVGYFIMTIIVILDKPAFKISKSLKKYDWICELVFIESFILIAFFGMLFVWRGLWNLEVLYIFPKDLNYPNDEKPFVTGAWLCFGGALLLLALARASRTIYDTSIFIDGKVEVNPVIITNFHYIELKMKSMKLLSPKKETSINKNSFNSALQASNRNITNFENVSGASTIWSTQL